MRDSHGWDVLSTLQSKRWQTEFFRAVMERK
jgi:hypothetical protein